MEEYDNLFLKMKDDEGYNIIVHRYTAKAWNNQGLRICCSHCLNTKVSTDAQDKTIQVCYDPEKQIYLCDNPKHTHNK